MGTSSSKIKQKWKSRISYYPDVDKDPSEGIIRTSRTILNEPSLVEDSRESILQVYLYKVSLYNIIGTSLLLYHSVIILQTTSWWWSIEKNEEEIMIQRSKNETAVKHKLLGEARIGEANIKLVDKSASNVNVKALLEFLDIGNETFDRYHLFERNCQVFGERIFQKLKKEDD